MDRRTFIQAPALLGAIPVPSVMLTPSVLAAVDELERRCGAEVIEHLRTDGATVTRRFDMPPHVPEWDRADSQSVAVEFTADCTNGLEQACDAIERAVADWLRESVRPGGNATLAVETYATDSEQRGLVRVGRLLGRGRKPHSVRLRDLTVHCAIRVVVK
jgi:hypothetical protein